MPVVVACNGLTDAWISNGRSHIRPMMAVLVCWMFRGMIVAVSIQQGSPHLTNDLYSCPGSYTVSNISFDLTYSFPTVYSAAYPP